MARQAKPYLHRGWWITEVGGTRTKLCREEAGREAAQEALDRLKVERHDHGGRSYPNLTVAELAAQFLQYAEVESPHSTFVHYQTKLKPFVARYGHKPARQLHLTDGVAYKKALMATESERTGRRLEACTINHHLRAAKRVLNWAVDHVEYLPKNPWKKVKLLAEKGRERVITDDEFLALLRHSSDALFRQILLTLRHTAARPGELRCLTWSMVNWDNHCWIIPARKTKTGSTAKQPKPRIIPMPSLVERLLRHREERHGDSERVFPDLNGNEWRADTFSQRFRRLRERAGIGEKDGEQLVLYSNRHTRLTELAPDVAAPLLQQVAGHTTFTMTQRYLHVANQQTYNAVLDADAKRRQRSGK